MTRALANGKSTLEIAKDMQRNHHTIKILVAASHEHKKHVQPKFNKLTERQQGQIHWQQTCRYLRSVIWLKYVVLLTVRRYKKLQVSKRPPEIHLSSRNINQKELNGPRNTCFSAPMF